MERSPGRARRGRTLGAYDTLLADRRFRRFLLIGALSFAAPAAILVLLSWAFVTAFPAVTDPGMRAQYAAIALAFLGIAATVPTLLSAVVSGTLADRYSRRALMRAANLLSLVATLGMVVDLIVRPLSPVNLPGPNGFFLPLWAIVVLPLWAVATAATTIFRPAYNASLPRIVPTASLGNANGLVFAAAIAASSAGTLLGPALAAIPSIDLGGALGLAVAFLAVTQLLLIGLDPEIDPPARSTRRRFTTEAADGYRFLYHRRALLQITFGALAINFLSSVAFVELGLYVRVWLALAQPIYLGALLTAASLGAGVGTLLIGRITFERRAGRLLAVFAALEGVAIVGFGLSPWFLLSLGSIFLFGMFPGMFQTVFMATVQATVPNEMLGRVFAADEVGSYAMVPVGQYAGGIVTLAVGVESAYLLAGSGTIAVGAVMATLPSLRRLGYQTSPGATPEPPAGAVRPAPSGPAEPSSP